MYACIKITCNSRILKGNYTYLAHCPINGDVRLQGTIYPYRGWVEVCVNGTWSTVCNGYHNWDSVDASVVCKQLGYSRHGKSDVLCMIVSTDLS